MVWKVIALLKFIFFKLVALTMQPKPQKLTKTFIIGEPGEINYLCVIWHTVCHETKSKNINTLTDAGLN